MFLEGLELLWQLPVSNFIRIEIADLDARTVFDFACSKLVQERSPSIVLFQVFGHMFRDQDVAGITAFHHPSR
jgi:hypothetical protein